MRNFRIFAILILCLPQLLAAAQAQQWNEASGVSLRSFSITPGEIEAGDSALFSILIVGSSDTAARYVSYVEIYDANKTLADRLLFTEAVIAGGETQSLTKPWNSKGRPAGEYYAIAGIVHGNSQLISGKLGFIISQQSSTTPAVLIPSASAPNRTGSAPAVSQPAPECQLEWDCLQWEECVDGYRVQKCQDSKKCTGESFYHIEKCAASKPFPANSAALVCVPLALIALLALAFYFFARKRQGL